MGEFLSGDDGEQIRHGATGGLRDEEQSLDSSMEDEKKSVLVGIKRRAGKVTNGTSQGG